MWGKNSPGAELKATEISREPGKTGTMVTYTLSGKGFPANGTYSLWGWILGRQPEKAIEGVTFNSNGLVACAPNAPTCKQTANVPIQIRTTAVLGEPKRFAVVSDDGRYAAFAEAVPFPIEAVNKNCKLSVVRRSPQAEEVRISASGFVPYEMLKVSAHLAGEDSVHSPTVSPQGTWEALVGTKALGADSGTATIKVTGQECSVQVSFKWGEGSTQQQ
jgi:hypothetical protein